MLDAGTFTYWGRIDYRGAGKISISTRSGNRSHPESNWSPWAPLQMDSVPPTANLAVPGALYRRQLVFCNTKSN